MWQNLAPCATLNPKPPKPRSRPTSSSLLSFLFTPTVQHYHISPNSDTYRHHQKPTPSATTAPNSSQQLKPTKTTSPHLTHHPHLTPQHHSTQAQHHPKPHPCRLYPPGHFTQVATLPRPPKSTPTCIRNPRITQIGNECDCKSVIAALSVYMSIHIRAHTPIYTCICVDHSCQIVN